MNIGQRKGSRGREEALGLRTFTVYEDLGAIAVRAHEYGLIVYLFIRQAGLAVDNLQELYRRVSQQVQWRWPCKWANEQCW